MTKEQLHIRVREFLRDAHAQVREFSDELINDTLADAVNYLNQIYFLNETVVKESGEVVILPSQLLNVRQVLVNGKPCEVKPRDLLTKEVYVSVGEDLQTLKVFNAGTKPQVEILANFAVEFDEKFDISPLFMNAIVYYACAELSQIALRENSLNYAVAFGKRFEGELLRLNKLFYNAFTGV